MGIRRSAMIPWTQRNFVWVNRTYGSPVIGVTGLTSKTHAENYSLVSFWHLWTCLLLKEAQFHTGSDKTGFRRIGYNLKAVWPKMKTGVAGPETTLKRFPEFFFRRTRKVFNLLQRNLVCLNRITDNRSTTCQIPLKTAKMAQTVARGHNVHFRHKWIDCRSVIVYPSWAN